jgi:hypothetical protein
MKNKFYTYIQNLQDQIVADEAEWPNSRRPLGTKAAEEEHA